MQVARDQAMRREMDDAIVRKAASFVEALEGRFRRPFSRKMSSGGAFKDLATSQSSSAVSGNAICAFSTPTSARPRRKASAGRSFIGARNDRDVATAIRNGSLVHVCFERASLAAAGSPSSSGSPNPRKGLLAWDGLDARLSARRLETEGKIEIGAFVPSHFTSRSFVSGAGCSVTSVANGNCIRLCEGTMRRCFPEIAFSAAPRNSL
jgi:hypothetical protein